MLGKNNCFCRPVPTLSTHSLSTLSLTLPCQLLQRFISIRISWISFSDFFFFFSDFFKPSFDIDFSAGKEKETYRHIRGNHRPLPVAVQCPSCDNHDLQTFPGFPFSIAGKPFRSGGPLFLSSLLRSLPLSRGISGITESVGSIRWWYNWVLGHQL